MRPYVCSPLRATTLHDSRTYFSLNFLRKTGLGMPEMFYGLRDFFFYRYISFPYIRLSFLIFSPCFPFFLFSLHFHLISTYFLSLLSFFPLYFITTNSTITFFFFLFISLFPSLFLFVSLMFSFSSFLSSSLAIDRKTRLLNVLGCFMHVVINIDRKTMK